MKKFKIFFDPRKEEKWLNDMNGYKLTKVKMQVYTFEETDKEYEYQVIYTSGKLNYLRLLNNVKGYVEEVDHIGVWTYLMKEKNNKDFYRRQDEFNECLKMYIYRYNLFSKSFMMFALSFLFLSISLNIYFLICAGCLGLLSYLYRRSIKTTKEILGEKACKNIKK